MIDALPCPVQTSGDIELYFYDELSRVGRRAVETHVAGCGGCREALDELRIIQRALATRPVVGAPRSGDWSGFMARLDLEIARTAAAPPSPVAVVGPVSRRPGTGSYRPLLAMAALLAIVTVSVTFVARSRSDVGVAMLPAGQDEAAGRPSDAAGAASANLTAVGQQHLERSKLVLLGLASKDAERTPASDWDYERELAGRLLTDTRLYRLTAEEQGMTTLAGVLRDLELVLLQTSMAEGTEPGALPQIQRAIRKRDLLQKMDMVRTTGT